MNFWSKLPYRKQLRRYLTSSLDLPPAVVAAAICDVSNKWSWMTRGKATGRPRAARLLYVFIVITKSSLICFFLDTCRARTYEHIGPPVYSDIIAGRPNLALCLPRPADTHPALTFPDNLFAWTLPYTRIRAVFRTQPS